MAKPENLARGSRIAALALLAVGLSGCVAQSDYYDQMRSIEFFAEASDQELDTIGQNLCADVSGRSDADTLRVLQSSGLSPQEAEQALDAAKDKHCPEL